MSVERHRPIGMLPSFVLGRSTIWWVEAWRRTDGAKRDSLSDSLYLGDC